MMRSFLSLASLFAAGAVASHLGPMSWSYYPENTADELKELGLPLPEIAAPITTVHEQESYVVKLECLGCPFRVREYGQIVEHWQDDPQDNSLLFNFSIAEDKHSLLVNGVKIMPLSLPVNLWAFQVPANLSANIMDKMVDNKLMSDSWKVGTQYGSFEISFEQTTMMTDERGIQLLQLDITHAEITSIRNPGVALLNQPKQKLIQLKLSRESMEADLKIKSIELVEQGEKMTHAVMPCGKEAPRFTQVFRATEWDYYGHIGTLKWTWNKAIGKTSDWISAHTLYIAALIIVLFVLKCRIIQQRRTAKKAIEDPEAALLIVEDGEEATPESAEDEPQAEPEFKKLVTDEKIFDEATPMEGEVVLDEEKKEEEPELTVSEESKPSLLD